MRVRTASAVCGLLLSGAVSVGAAAPALAAPCDAYSQTCPSTPPSTIGGGGTGGGTAPTSAPTPVANGNSNPGGGAPNEGRTLPFTGAELALLTVVGGTAIAGGAAFVVAGRRRRVDAA